MAAISSDRCSTAPRGITVSWSQDSRSAIEDKASVWRWKASRSFIAAFSEIIGSSPARWFHKDSARGDAPG